jgi:hypothetical protein
MRPTHGQRRKISAATIPPCEQKAVGARTARGGATAAVKLDAIRALATDKAVGPRAATDAVVSGAARKGTSTQSR